MHEAVAGKMLTNSSLDPYIISFTKLVSDAATAIAACGVSPIVRIAANEGWMVKRKDS